MAVVCAAAGAAALVAAQAAQQQPAPAGQLPIFRGATNLVVVDAYPQRDGRIVEGLTPDDFEIIEEGAPQKIAAFEFVRVEPSPETARRDPNNLSEMAAMLADPHRRAFVIYLDTIHTRVEGGAMIRAPLVDMLNRIIAPGDLFAVMVPRMRPSDLTFGARSLAVEEQLTKYWAWGERDRLSPDPTDPIEQRMRSCFHKKLVMKDGAPQFVDWLVPDGPAVRFFDDILVERHRVDRTLTSLRDLVTHLGRLRDTRTVVMTVSDGWVLDPANRALEGEPTRPPPDIRMQRAALALPMTRERDEFAQCITDLSRVANLDNAGAFRDLVTLANRTNVSVYPVATSGLAAIDTPINERISVNPANRTQETMLGRDANRLQGRVQALRTLAEQTDGIAIVQTNDLAGGIRRIVDDVSAYYLMGYSPTNAKADGRYRRIEVRMKRPGVNIRARRGYVAETEAVRATAARAASASGARAAVGPSPVADALAVLAKLAPTAPLFMYGAARTGALAVVIEVPRSEAAAGRWLAGADVRVDVTGANGQAAGSATARIEANARSVMVAVPLAIGAASPWRVAAKITGRDGSLEDQSTIEPVAAGELVGAPIVYRATPSPRSPLRPAADMLFSRTERAHVEWPRLKAVDTTSARVLTRTGEPLAILVAATVRDDPAGAVVVADVNLAPLGAGDYLIEVTVTAAGVTEKHLIAIRVDR